MAQNIAIGTLHRKENQFPIKIKAVPKEDMAKANKAAPKGEYPLRLSRFSNTALNWGNVEIKDREVPIFIKKSIIFISSSPFPLLNGGNFYDHLLVSLILIGYSGTVHGIGLFILTYILFPPKFGFLLGSGKNKLRVKEFRLLLCFDLSFYGFLDECLGLFKASEICFIPTVPTGFPTLSSSDTGSEALWEFLSLDLLSCQYLCYRSSHTSLGDSDLCLLKDTHLYLHVLI